MRTIAPRTHFACVHCLHKCLVCATVFFRPLAPPRGHADTNALHVPIIVGNFCPRAWSLRAAGLALYQLLWLGMWQTSHPHGVVSREQHQREHKGVYRTWYSLVWQLGMLLARVASLCARLAQLMAADGILVLVHYLVLALLLHYIVLASLGPM